FIRFDETLASVTPAVLYLVLHTIEGQLVTPIILGRSMALSPLVLILALMLFGWLWGLVGLLLAVPLLACVKLVLEQVEGMQGWAGLLECRSVGLPTRGERLSRRVAPTPAAPGLQCPGDGHRPRHHPRPRRRAVAVRPDRRA